MLLFSPKKGLFGALSPSSICGGDHDNNNSCRIRKRTMLIHRSICPLFSWNFEFHYIPSRGYVGKYPLWTKNWGLWSLVAEFPSPYERPLCLYLTCDRIMKSFKPFSILYPSPSEYPSPSAFFCTNNVLHIHYRRSLCISSHPRRVCRLRYQQPSCRPGTSFIQILFLWSCPHPSYYVVSICGGLMGKSYSSLPTWNYAS